ncbi:MAG TPA: SH3 domain-containing protein [Casimicrobiaceae bacterium]|nr:SH3 domain-containing protein [Casimicrobiaceae bacterium]
MKHAWVAFCAALLASAAHATEYRTTAEQPTVLFDGPSAKAKPQFLYSRDVPLEVIVNLEGWAKVRDVGGTIGWIERKALSDKRMLVVRGTAAEVRAGAEDSAPLVFRAEPNVLLELAESAVSPSTTGVPGWVKVKHRDGPTGFVRINQVFGL